MSNWTDVSEVIISKWSAFNRTEADVTGDIFLTVSLEEINKRWDRSNNWAMTITNPEGTVLAYERFYLSMNNFSAENAQKRADELVAEFWNPKPVVDKAELTFGSDKPLLVVQEKNYGSGSGVK